MNWLMLLAALATTATPRVTAEGHASVTLLEPVMVGAAYPLPARAHAGLGCDPAASGGCQKLILVEFE